MLTFNFTRIFKARGIVKPFSYLVNAGYSYNFATRIVNNKHQKLNLKDIEKLCVLFKCTPNDLLEWNPGKNDRDIDNHPLISLKRDNKDEQISRILNSIPIDKLDKIENFIKNEIEGL